MLSISRIPNWFSLDVLQSQLWTQIFEIDIAGLKIFIEILRTLQKLIKATFKVCANAWRKKSITINEANVEKHMPHEVETN